MGAQFHCGLVELRGLVGEGGVIVPRLIRVTELAELLGVSGWSLRKACREDGYQLLRVRRPSSAKCSATLYISTADAAKVARVVMGKTADAALRARFKRTAERRGFGPGAEVELDRPPDPGAS